MQHPAAVTTHGNPSPEARHGQVPYGCMSASVCARRAPTYRPESASGGIQLYQPERPNNPRQLLRERLHPVSSVTSEVRTRAKR